MEEDQHRSEYECVRAELHEHLDRAAEGERRGIPTPPEEMAFMRRLQTWINEHQPGESWYFEVEPVDLSPDMRPVVEVETDDLTPETRAEIEAVAELTDDTADREELDVIDERVTVLVQQRALLMKDVLAPDRLERLHAIENELRGHEERANVLRSLIGIQHAE